MPSLSCSLKMLVDDVTAIMVNAAMPCAQAEAQWLVCQVLNIPRYRFATHPQDAVEREDLKKVKDALHRRMEGEPLAYIVQNCSFCDLQLHVTPDVLIPRPETEELVIYVRDWAKEYGHEKPKGLDLGTGSGCIALALAHYLPAWKWHASDISPRALTVADKNAHVNKLNIDFRLGNWHEPWKGELFDLIVCNPPYIAYEQAFLVSAQTLAFEPSLALFAQEQGLAVYRQLSKLLLDITRSKGLIAFEMGFAQEKELPEIFSCQGWIRGRIINDMCGKPRFFFIERE